MSDETDREIARLRDLLRDSEHQNAKLRELRDSLTDTIAHLVRQEREQKTLLDATAAQLAECERDRNEAE